MRVLYLTSEYPPRIGGVGTHVAELAAAVRSTGVKIKIIAPPCDGADRYDDQYPNPDLVRYAPQVRAQPFYDYALRRWCKRYLDRGGFDLVHVHGLRPLRTALSLGLPVIFTNHTSGFLKTVAGGGRRLEKISRLIAACAHVLAPSEELLEAVRAAGYSGPATYIPNGVDVSRFTPGTNPALRATWGFEQHHLVAVIARRLVPKNGVLIAAQALQFCDPEVRFVFVGDGPERHAIEMTLTRGGRRDRAELLGAVQNSAMPDVYRAVDVCLLPSLIEATSIAGLEAMAAGRVLIGTRVGGIPALIDDGVSGILIPPSDPSALAAAVNAFARNRERIGLMGAAARQRAETDFAWPRITERTIGIYQRVLAGC